MGESLKRGHTDSDSAEEEEELWSKMDVITTEQMHPSTKTKSEWKWILLRDIVKALCMCGHMSSAKITISITTKQKRSLNSWLSCRKVDFSRAECSDCNTSGRS